MTVLSPIVLAALTAASTNAVELETVRVHFIAHSHMDAGWLKSFDEYYYEQVVHIMDSVIKELVDHPSFSYTVGDLAFFRRYYESQANER